MSYDSKWVATGVVLLTHRSERQRRRGTNTDRVDPLVRPDLVELLMYRVICTVVACISSSYLPTT